jgi:dienelactone hydrolase
LRTNINAVVLTALGLALLIPGVAGGAPSTHNRTEASVVPRVSLADEPLQILVAGLPAGALASIQLRSTDARGTRWVSLARFRADSQGRIDVRETPALGGSYRGVWDMGLVASMLPEGPPPNGSYAWAGSERRLFALVVRHAGGRVAAHNTFTRTLSLRPIRRQVAPLGKTGFSGEYYAPAGVLGRPAVLAFGGAAGGLRTTRIASMLAAHGYPTLAVAYFRQPGLPNRISGVPLEYFARALRWLREQPEVDRDHVLTLGISRGSEAALLLGVHYPRLVHGVIGSVPNNRALCPTGDCSRAPWTVRGREIPYTNEFDNPYPTDDPNAVIHVERIQGPVFLACAEADRTWNSCAFSRAIMRRLAANNHGHGNVLVVDRRAGHMLGTLVPHQPLPCSCHMRRADERGRAAVWPKLIAFLDDVQQRG